jgi:hypothetical protein
LLTVMLEVAIFFDEKNGIPKFYTTWDMADIRTHSKLETEEQWAVLAGTPVAELKTKHGYRCTNLVSCPIRMIRTPVSSPTPERRWGRSWWGHNYESSEMYVERLKKAMGGILARGTSSFAFSPPCHGVHPIITLVAFVKAPSQEGSCFILRPFFGNPRPA